MPKGKPLQDSGIGEAWKTDASHANSKKNQEGKHVRISITISPILLKAIDSKVKELKQQGVTTNRSQLLTEAAATSLKTTEVE